MIFLINFTTTTEPAITFQILGNFINKIIYKYIILFSSHCSPGILGNVQVRFHPRVLDILLIWGINWYPKFSWWLELIIQLRFRTLTSSPLRNSSHRFGPDISGAFLPPQPRLQHWLMTTALLTFIAGNVAGIQNFI